MMACMMTLRLRWTRTLLSVKQLCAVVTLAFLATHAGGAEKLKLLLMASSGTQRTSWMQMVDAFEKANPHIQVESTVLEQEQYKRDFESIIRREAIDVAFWFAGERLRRIQQSGALDPIESGLAKEVGDVVFTRASWDSVRYGSQHFAWPLSYYAWGFLYSRYQFAKLGLRVPTQWRELLAISKRLHDAGVAPFAVGAGAGWPAAAWFDYLNLRMNGLEFHRRLLVGQESFFDRRVSQVLTEWKMLLSKGYFLNETIDKDWDSVLPYLYRQKTGMVLLGGFAVGKIPTIGPGGLDLRSDIDFFPFPQVAKSVGRFEDAPLDVLVLPAKGKNRPAALQFLRFVATSGQLSSFNGASGMLAPLSGSMREGARTMRSAKDALDRADGLAFFFDRDARTEAVPAALDAFRRFLIPPHNVPELQAALERAMQNAKADSPSFR